MVASRWGKLVAWLKEQNPYCGKRCKLTQHSLWEARANRRKLFGEQNKKAQPSLFFKKGRKI